MAELRVKSTGTLKLFESDNTSSVTIASPASLGADRTVTLPDADVTLVSGTMSTVALSGSTNNQVTTVTGANAITGEANLTFDGSTLAVTGAATVSTTLGVTGNITTDGLMRLTQTTDPSAVAGKSLVYAKAPGGGGTGVYVQAPTGNAEEMVSKSKAIVYGLIF